MGDTSFLCRLSNILVIWINGHALIQTITEHFVLNCDRYSKLNKESCFTGVCNFTPFQVFANRNCQTKRQNTPPKKLTNLSFLFIIQKKIKEKLIYLFCWCNDKIHYKIYTASLPVKL